MNDISTKIVKLDLDFILDHCHKPALWDKKWSIFKYDGYTVTFQLEKIVISNKQLEYLIKIYKDGSCLSTSWYNSMNFQKEHRNLVVLNNSLNSKVLMVMGWVENDMTRKTTAYKEAQQYESNLVDLAEKVAISFLNSEGVTNENIRDAYISSEKAKHQTSSYTIAVLEKYRGTKLSKLYVSYCLFSGNKEKYDEYKKIAKLNGFAIGALRKEIKENLALIECGEMAEKMELELDSIK